MFVRCQDIGGVCARHLLKTLDVCGVCRDDCQVPKTYTFSECYDCGFDASMTFHSPPTLQSATHVAVGIGTTERLTKMGARSMVPSAENLLLGPCRRDAKEHMRLRDLWWGHADTTWDRLYAPDVRWEPPVVVWVSSSPRERLSLWRTCSWLDHLGLSHRDVIILDFERGPHGDPDFDPYGCCQRVCDFPDETLLARLAEGRPWPRVRYQRAADLWHRYVDADPSGFAQTCARGLDGFPELANVWSLMSNFFPRQTADGVLHLSRYDELLLKRLSAKWSDPVIIFADGPDPWLDLGYCTGDLFVPMRLKHWFGHGPSPALERAPGPRGPDRPMLSSIYRITKHGRQLRRRLPDLADAPRLPVGGAEAYAPESPWVLRDDGRLARL